jgi:protein ImuB
MYACLHGPGNLTALASEFSPTVEQTAPATVTFDVSGLERLFGLPQDIAHAINRRASELGIRANVALAMNPDTAVCAARGFSGVSIVPEGDEAKFLATLPLSLLAPTPDLAETLERWGIRRFHDLAALPPLGIAERLGEEGLRLRALARGDVSRKLLAIEETLTFEDEIELEYPVDLLEPLAFLLARLLNGLATRLATRGLATDQIHLRLKLDPAGSHERTVRLPVPTLDTRAFLKLLQLDLAANPPKAPVAHIRMAMNPVKPQAAQSGLFLPATPEPVQLDLTLARIKSIVGRDGVLRPTVPDTHGPGGPIPTVSGAPRLAFRYFRPPLSAKVSLAETRPAFVTAGAIRGKVLDLSGPWRTSGHWWTLDPYERDEWDISLSDGALYRLYCAPLGWYLEGSYD